jgi:alkylhydroperoxidase family enzyme
MDKMKVAVLEANERCNRSIEGLSRELDRADRLQAHLRAAQNECSEACNNVEAADVTTRFFFFFFFFFFFLYKT